MIRHLFLLGLGGLAGCQAGPGDNWRPPRPAATVWHCGRVLDGDTLAATRSDWPGADIHIRLYGVDAPEHNRPGGKEATAATRGMVEGKDFTIIAHGKEKYGRDLAEVFVDGQSVGQMLLARHLAVVYHGAKRDPAAVSAQVEKELAAPAAN